MVLKKYTYRHNMTKSFDIKSDFDIFKTNPDLVFLDSASTSLIPQVAVRTTERFLSSTVVSSRKGAYNLAVRGSEIVESTRRRLADFLSTSASQLSFQKSLPSAAASLAYGYSWKEQNRDKIVLAQTEENSIYVSLLRVAQVLNLELKIIPCDRDGNLDLHMLDNEVDDRTGIVAVGHVSPGIGTYNNLGPITAIARDHNALVLTDATRSIGFADTKPSSLGSDIILFSGNIGLLGPPGLAVQWIDNSVAENHIPGILGGSSVSNVYDMNFELALHPDKFESGYINVPAIAGLGSSIEYLTSTRSQGMYSHIRNLSRHFLKALNELTGIEVYGKPDENTTIFGFNLAPPADVSCHDVALFLDESGIAVRSGLICAHPIIQSVHPEGIIQASIHAYNDIEDIERLQTILSAILAELA